MNSFRVSIFGVLILASLLFGDCRNQRIMESGTENQANSTPKTDEPEKKVDDFAERLKDLRTANFEFIFVFRRKDGAELNSEDKQFLKLNAQPEPNRWVLTGDKKAVIAGSNFVFEEKVLQNLRSRFNVEDYSKEGSK